MAIKVSTTTVISDTRQLQNIASVDGITQASINTAIQNVNNILRIYDSTGAEVRTLFCGAPTP